MRDIALCCINLIMHRLRVGTDGMHYEIINCTSSVSTSVGCKIRYQETTNASSS